MRINRVRMGLTPSELIERSVMVEGMRFFPRGRCTACEGLIGFRISNEGEHIDGEVVAITIQNNDTSLARMICINCSPKTVSLEDGSRIFIECFSEGTLKFRRYDDEIKGFSHNIASQKFCTMSDADQQIISARVQRRILEASSIQKAA